MLVNPKVQRIIQIILPFITGLVLIAWLIYTPEGLLGKADAVGYAVCHRIDVRSFFLEDRQAPLCARCTGQYLGVMITLAFLFSRGSRKKGIPPRRILVSLAGLFLLWGFDGANSMASLLPGSLNLYPPNNILRLLTGLGFGMAAGTAVFLAFNQVTWKHADQDSALPGFKPFFLLAAWNLAGGLLILWQNPLLLYPLMLISAMGVVAILSMIYAVLWVTIFRLDNQFSSWHGLALPLLAGFGLAITQVAVMDLVRYTFTGTWEGFHIFL